MSEEKEFIPKRAMSIHAHPDDQEFTVAGTLAKWAKTGCEIVSVIITSGDGGSNDPAHDASYKPTLAKIREGEQSAANEALGVKQTIYLHYPDGELEPTVALRKEVTRLIRMHKPEAVVTGDPQAVFYGNGYINHPDHRAAAQVATYAASPPPGRGWCLPICWPKVTSRTTSNGCTCTALKNPIPGWTSPRRSMSKSPR